MPGKGFFLRLIVGISAFICLSVMLMTQTISHPTINEHTDTDLSQDYEETHRKILHDEKQKVNTTQQQGRNVPLSCTKHDIHTFFVDIEHDFTKISTQDRIVTSELLESAESLAGMFDKLGKVAFGAVRSNYMKNINGIAELYKANPEKYKTINDIIDEDVKNGRLEDIYSTTDSVYWLARSLYFISILLEEMSKKPTFSEALSKSYSQVLRPHHSWFIRGLVAAAFSAAPSKESAEIVLGSTEGEYTKPGYKDCCYDSIRVYNEQVRKTCNNINKYFIKQGRPIW